MTCHLYHNLFLRFDWDFPLVKTLPDRSIELFIQFIQY
ncbi:hypothetical protein F383_20308 [Gossypium arboreum]|uniref:Uncharacterized protein n=1 Tax=Gossypium arboreum TaxID=29729 RepID=A0A0B0MB76_GOSAR|nr:hypothetical protein F383_20308 [Gossypium arboreum]